MSDFKFMDDVVNEICQSMREDPDRWLISTYTVEDRKGGIKYWTSSGNSINLVWTGQTTERVFSHEQGVKVYQAFIGLRNTKQSLSQEKVINSFKSMKVSLQPKKKVEEIKATKKWWEFWK